MTTIDIIILVILAYGFYKGWKLGLVKEIVSLIGIVFGLFVARLLFGTFAEKLAPAIGTSIWIAKVLAFLIIWIGIPIALSIGASIINMTLNLLHLGGANKGLGSIFGALKYMLMMGMVIILIDYFDPHNHIISETKKNESLLYKPIAKTSGLFFPIVKTMTIKKTN